MGGGNLHRTPAAGVSRSVRSYALALCMAFAIAAVPVQAQVKNITLKASNTPVSTVMQQIEEQSGYTFFYNTKDIPLDRNVTLSVANKDIRAALDELFRNTNVSYSIDNKSIILSARGGAQPQQASQITGRIVDKNGVPVIGATIMISGTTQGTTSGVDGTFALQSNVSPAGMVLDVSFIGYKPQRISVNNRTSLSVTLEEDDQQIEAVVVTAEGIIPNNEYNRYNFTANHSSSFLDERMHLSVLGMYMNVNEQNMLSSGQYYNPMIPVYLMSPSDDIRKYAVYERYNASRNFPVQYWPWGSQSLQMQNPYWITNRNMFNTGKDRFLFGASLKYDVTDWLDITGRARIDYTHITAEQKNYASTLGLFAGDKGRYYNNTYITSQRYADVLANFHKTFADGAFSLNATLGASIEDYKHRAILLGGDLTGVPNLFTLANMTTNKSQAKETINDQTQSLFATLQLGYKNMVFLDVTARNDWVTALANTSKTSMFYPSVGLSAVLTDIFKVDSRVLSFAKIRASYAEVGNAPMRWITIPTYPVSDGTPQTSTYLTSDDFKPERTKSWEVGADVRLWGNKLILNATYYSSRTYNQVFNPDISSTSTYSSLYVNAGRVDNKGVEVSAELNQNLGPVKWSSNLVYSRNRNKVVDMLDSYKLSNGTVISQDSMVMGGTTGVKMVLREGGQIGDIYVNTLKTDEHGAIWVSPTGSNVAPAKDTWIYAGNSNPSYTLSWRNEFNWKGLSLGFMFNARVGGVGVSLTQAAMDYFGVSERTATDRLNGGALVNGQRIPAENYYQTIGGNGADAIGACYVYSMTNVRLGELTLGYDIPVQKWCKWIKGLNVSFIGRNLWMLYCKAPFDPETVAGTGTFSSGIDYFMQPSTRNLGFSVKVTF